MREGKGEGQGRRAREGSIVILHGNTITIVHVGTVLSCLCNTTTKLTRVSVIPSIFLSSSLTDACVMADLPVWIETDLLTAVHLN